MGWICSTHEGREKFIRVSIGNLEGKVHVKVLGVYVRAISTCLKDLWKDVLK
jgi:hypothetical protein